MKFYFFHAPAEVGSYTEYVGWWALTALQTFGLVLAFTNIFIWAVRA